MKNKGFSLVELIVVIAIIATLVGVAVPVYTNYIKRAEETSDAAFLADISKSAQLFAAENGLELGAVWVAPVVTDSQGLLLYDKQGNFYDGDLSALYAMLGGGYDFKTLENDAPIYFDTTPVVPEESVEGHTHSEGTVVPPTCVSAGYTVCDTCKKNYNVVPSEGHSLSDETYGNLTLTRCANCDYTKVTFGGELIGNG